MASSGNKPFTVEGKRAIITGGGSGINYCLTKLLLSRGCNVLIADLTLRPESKALVAEYSGKDNSKPRCVFQKTDVTVWKELEKAFEAADHEFGGVDIVGPGAGVFEEPWSNFWYPPGSKQSKDDKHGDRYRMMDINVTHPIRMAQMAIATFLNPKDGKKVSPENPKRITMTASIAGQVFGLPTPMYIASKWAVSGFTRSLGGLEETLGIRVNAVAPGVVRTPLFLDHPEKMKYVDESKDIWVTPEEIAEGMVKLMEDPELVGGTIYEIGSGCARIVPPFNNPGPQGPGHQVSNGDVMVEEVYQQLAGHDWGKF